jgi:hypothetical protein
MMMVDTEVRQSPIHGLGVFLKEPVKAGTLLWRFDPRVDRVYAEDEIAALPPHMQEYLRIYSTWHEPTGLYVLCGDNGRYVNHSETPNSISAAPCFGDDHAAVDLPAGTEMTSDYRLICDRVRQDGMEFTLPSALTGGGVFPGLPAGSRINGGAHHQPR